MHKPHINENKTTSSPTHTVMDTHSTGSNVPSVASLPACTSSPPTIASKVNDLLDAEEEDAISSDGTSNHSSTGSIPTKKRGRTDLMDAIREYTNDFTSSEVAKQLLCYMEKEEVRRQQEDNRLEVEHRQKMRQYLLDFWEKMHANIRALRRDLRDEWLDNESKREIEEDIAALVKRKNELATELGLK